MWKDVAAARHGRSELCLGIGPTAKRITNSTLSQNLEAYLLLVSLDSAGRSVVWPCPYFSSGAHFAMLAGSR
jgi:hypothetical protein